MSLNQPDSALGFYSFVIFMHFYFIWSNSCAFYYFMVRQPSSPKIQVQKSLGNHEVLGEILSCLLNLLDEELSVFPGREAGWCEKMGVGWLAAGSQRSTFPVTAASSLYIPGHTHTGPHPRTITASLSEAYRFKGVLSDPSVRFGV